MENDSELISLISLDTGEIKRRIFAIRGKQVMPGKNAAGFYRLVSHPGKKG